MDILTIVSLSRIMEMYPVYHEMDISHFTDYMDEQMKQARQVTRLKRIRLGCGMSQAQLASNSGVALRQIQLFEQRQRDIDHAAAITLFQLSKSLHCRMEDLLE